MHRVMIFTEYFLKLQSNPKLSHLPSCHCVPHYNCKVVSREALEKCKCNKLKAMPPAMQIKTSKPQFPFQSHILQMLVPLSAKLQQDRNSQYCFISFLIPYGLQHPDFTASGKKTSQNASKLGFWLQDWINGQKSSKLRFW